MEAVLSSILTLFGGGAGLLSFAVLLAVVLGALVFARFTGNKSGVTERVVNLASYAVMAVRKLSDNGEYEGLSEEERHAAKKQQALTIIEHGLKAEGITPNAALMSFAGFAIETVLKQLDADPKVSK